MFMQKIAWSNFFIAIVVLATTKRCFCSHEHGLLHRTDRAIALSKFKHVPTFLLGTIGAVGLRNAFLQGLSTSNWYKTALPAACLVASPLWANHVQLVKRAKERKDYWNWQNAMKWSKPATPWYCVWPSLITAALATSIGAYYSNLTNGLSAGAVIAVIPALYERLYNVMQREKDADVDALDLLRQVGDEDLKDLLHNDMSPALWALGRFVNMAPRRKKQYIPQIRGYFISDDGCAKLLCLYDKLIENSGMQNNDDNWVQFLQDLGLMNDLRKNELDNEIEKILGEIRSNTTQAEALNGVPNDTRKQLSSTINGFWQLLYQKLNERLDQIKARRQNETDSQYQIRLQHLQHELEKKLHEHEGIEYERFKALLDLYKEQKELANLNKKNQQSCIIKKGRKILQLGNKNATLRNRQ